jgi:hypothetical protein
LTVRGAPRSTAPMRARGVNRALTGLHHDKEGVARRPGKSGRGWGLGEEVEPVQSTAVRHRLTPGKFSWRRGAAPRPQTFPKDFAIAPRPRILLGNNLNSLYALGKSPLRISIERVQSRDHSQSTGFRFLCLTAWGFESPRSHMTSRVLSLESPKRLFESREKLSKGRCPALC